MAGEQQLTQRVPTGLVADRTSTGKAFWKLTADDGVEWRIWEPAIAHKASALAGQMAVWTVRVSPARDPRYGYNYAIVDLNGTLDGVATTPMTPMAPAQLPGMAPAPFAGVPVPPPGVAPQVPMMPGGPTGLPVPPAQPQKTMGQGGQFSDSDILRMSRSAAVGAVVSVAFMPEDFRDEENQLDWSRVYLAAEAIAKFITHRRHQGWTPGVEIENPAPEQTLLSELQQTFGEGAVVQGIPEPEPPEMASAEHAGGGSVSWD